MSSLSLTLPIWNEVTAIFGGRFDPPHLGHREAVRGLFQNPGVGRVLVIPTASPTHKPASASIENRYEMAKLNFQSSGLDSYPSEVYLNDCEVQRYRLHPDLPSFTYDTLQELRRSIPKLAFVIGTDQLAELHRWSRFPQILGLTHWIVLERKSSAQSTAQVDQFWPKGQDLSPFDHPRKTLQNWSTQGLANPVNSYLWKLKQGPFLILVPTEAHAISSTEIRESIARTGEPPEFTLLPEVVHYLKSAKLYGHSA